jgi:acyl carrier protein
MEENMDHEKFDQAFITAFDIDSKILGNDLKYESIQEWDSIGHMALIAELEDAFEISMEMDDIIDFSSYVKGIDILKKYI